MSKLLQVEGASCACMADLDANFENPWREVFFWDRSRMVAD
jgi:hypothetical protein